MGIRNTTDVFVVGGGPAGLAVAIAARGRGLSVTLADGSAPPIEKPCGEGMSPDTVAALHSLGVSFHHEDGVPFRGIAFIQPGARAAADFTHGSGLGLRRIALHERLVARAEECGVQLLWRTPVAGIGQNEVHLAHGESHDARWIVGADGPGSRVRQRVGIGSRRIHRRFATRRHFKLVPWSAYVEVHWGSRAQAYVTPVASHETSVVILASRAEDADFELAIREFPEIESRIAGAALASRERGAVTSQHELTAVHRGNVALVGDASGGVDAITGDGIRLALLQAQTLADAISRDDVSLYARAHRKLMRGPMRAGEMLLLLDRHPRLRARVVRALAANPNLFQELLAQHAGHARRPSLVAAGAQLGWRMLAT
jgi:flavin-dependent dehydrogenase